MVSVLSLSASWFHIGALFLDLQLNCDLTLMKIMVVYIKWEMYRCDERLANRRTVPGPLLAALRFGQPRNRARLCMELSSLHIVRTGTDVKFRGR
jgi:hypothetical protein